jgi:hypothetical protein
MDKRYYVKRDSKILHKYDDYDQALYVALTYFRSVIFDNVTKQIIFED